MTEDGVSVPELLAVAVLGSDYLGALTTLADAVCAYGDSPETGGEEEREAMWDAMRALRANTIWQYREKMKAAR